MTFTDDEKTIGLIETQEELPKISNLDKWKTRLLHITIGLSFTLFIYLSLDLFQTRSMFIHSCGDDHDLNSITTNIRESMDIKDVYSFKNQDYKHHEELISRDDESKEQVFDPEHVEYKDEDDYPHLGHSVNLNLI
ncbi:hypothetical protein BN7_1757 [Wickerhamomyces ciferrii]|uniref:Uncharacterized protein n=1 Tax=Wickerhamomyces ciferrii (strain ATCC 14091 / BCRC 22168 / CBS 111 / JCM 3599 / NBRC 0793 / NRRL Y-1031 F-60-10) TaxID=1206466 RepID=K0KM66_WICCF|nr:uncharacterized protein BN7_1757 [Wickerhamomyces ciferrii]CCH42213.1 hypothetical protein BN7_1757 [Wickerhamomyces ciferrii]